MSADPQRGYAIEARTAGGTLVFAASIPLSIVASLGLYESILTHGPLYVYAASPDLPKTAEPAAPSPEPASSSLPPKPESSAR
jgi:hypothetical protein